MARRTKTARTRQQRQAALPSANGYAFRRLLDGNIIGIVDAYGAVHSKFTGEEIAHHSTHWPNQTHCLWRWNHDKSVHWFLASSKPNGEQLEAIQHHLTKRYGLLWWENGHHDIDDLLAKCEREEKHNAEVSGQPPEE